MNVKELRDLLALHPDDMAVAYEAGEGPVTIARFTYATLKDVLNAQTTVKTGEVLVLTY